MKNKIPPKQIIDAAEVIRRIHNWMVSENCWIEDENGNKLPNAQICGKGLKNYILTGKIK